MASIAASLLKFGVLWLGVTKIFINFFLKNDAVLKAPQISKMTAVISFNYSFPQIATALIGCILIYAIYPVLIKAVIEGEEKANAKN